MRSVRILDISDAYTKRQLVRWRVVGSTRAVHRLHPIVIIIYFPKKVK